MGFSIGKVMPFFISRRQKTAFLYSQRQKASDLITINQSDNPVPMATLFMLISTSLYTCFAGKTGQSPLCYLDSAARLDGVQWLAEIAATQRNPNNLNWIMPA